MRSATFRRCPPWAARPIQPTLASCQAMPKVTITLSEAAYREALAWAALNHTTVSAVVRYCIERLPGLPIARQALAETDARFARVQAAAKAASTPARPGPTSAKKQPRS